MSDTEEMMGFTYTPFREMLLSINSENAPYGVDGIAYPFTYDLTWMYYAAIVIAFLAAAGIGANDVANSFATSVGSKSLTLFQAVCIAAVFEFAGAVLLGAGVASTIKSGIVSPASFSEGNDDLLMAGFFAALISTTFWLFLATFLELPVSTTHSIVGAVIGFGLVAPMAEVTWAMDWEKGKGVFYVMIGWVVAPAVSGTFSSIFFLFVRNFILRSENSFERTLKFFPVITAVVVLINVFLTINKGAKGKGWKNEWFDGNDFYVLGASAGVGAVIGLLIQFLLIPKIRERLEAVADDDENLSELEAKADPDFEDEVAIAAAKADAANQKESGKSMWDRIKAQDGKIHDNKDDKVTMIHDGAEKFEKRTEMAFGYLQVMTACAMSFAHGANDVANAIGPLAGIVSIYENNMVENAKAKAAADIWILALGGAGISFGLLVYGHKIIRALGVKLIKISPARGSCIELATAFTIVVGSVRKLPLSTTQVMVGASIGVGLVESYTGRGTNEGLAGTVNRLLLAKIVAGWVMTLVIAASVSGLIFALMVYSPNINRPLSAFNCLAEYAEVVSKDTAIDLATNISYALIGDAQTGGLVLGDLEL